MVLVKYNGAVSKYPDENVINVDKWRTCFIYISLIFRQHRHTAKIIPRRLVNELR